MKPDISHGGAKLIQNIIVLKNARLNESPQMTGTTSQVLSLDTVVKLKSNFLSHFIHIFVFSFRLRKQR